MVRDGVVLVGGVVEGVVPVGAWEVGGMQGSEGRRMDHADGPLSLTVHRGRMGSSDSGFVTLASEDIVKGSR